MDVKSLAEWHRKQAARASGRLQLLDSKACPKKDFHLDAATLVESLSSNERDRLLLHVEIDVKLRAVESLEKLGKRLIEESRDLKKMLSDEVSDE